MLLLALRFAGWRIRPVRVALGALLGALCAQAAVPLSHTARMLLWLPVALVMMLVTGGRRAARAPGRAAGLLLCAAGLLGGIVLSLYGATGSLRLAYALGGAAALAVMLLHRQPGRPVPARAQCRLHGQTASFRAMADSGNTLRDYLTHLPVIVAPEEVGRRLLHLEGAALRPIFADTAGGRQMMQCFLPEETIITLDGEQRRVRAAWALSPGLAENAPALIPGALLEGWAGGQYEKQRGMQHVGTGKNEKRRTADDETGSESDPAGGHGRLHWRERFASASAQARGGG